ncbi:type I restriction enzyme S subunit [Vibrio crassostreae]|uniref:restriction endonuclease subunit S n=1 Tax=Vibrio crassostreae TaxID=246167 RepID=UPI000F4E9C77|nr:restriction endonuclease subunit S [Vibrio crassostreae]RPF00052.1 type I restriction enzyme S subunit [Vibrio crassostreae]
MKENQLPEAWIECRLGDVVELKYGKSLPQKIRDGGQYPVFGSNGVVGSHSHPLVNSEGLIVGRKGSYGTVHISRVPFFPIDTTYFIDDFAGQPIKYWFYQLKQLPFKDLNRATAIPGLNRDDAYSQLVSVPPLAEQQVIADRLDDLFTQIENIKNRLEHTLQTLKRYRQSVLAAAVDGELTATWRKGEKKWQQKPLEELASHIVDCPHSTPKWSKTGKYCVRTTAFNPFFLDLSEQGFVSEEVYRERIQRLKPLPDDILYSREGTIGIACQIPQDVELCLGQRMILIRAGAECNSKYLTIVLNSERTLSVVNSKSVGSTVPRINMRDIKKIPIPTPSLKEQEEIVRCVERLFLYGEAVEEQVKSALSKINNLTSSTLNAALKGNLTADWRGENQELICGDNNAASLLRKIKLNKELSQNKRKEAKADIKKKVSMKKTTEDEVNDWVVKHKESTFTFEQLLTSIGGDYEHIKDSVFAALSNKKPLFKQYFDDQTGSIAFVKEKL